MEPKDRQFKEGLRTCLPWVPALAWMGVIFSLSAQPAPESASLSTGLSDVLLDAVRNISPGLKTDPEAFNEALRTAAHFGIYHILGALLLPAVWLRWRKDAKWTILASLAIGAIYAVSDELHQLFVPGRGAQLTDVLVDASGALTGALLAYGILTLVGRIRKRKKKI